MNALVILNPQTLNGGAKTDPFPKLEMFLAQNMETGHVFLVLDSHSKRSVLHPGQWRIKTDGKRRRMKLDHDVEITLSDKGKILWDGKDLPAQISVSRSRLRQAISAYQVHGLKFKILKKSLPKSVNSVLLKKLVKWSNGKERKFTIVKAGATDKFPELNAFKKGGALSRAVMADHVYIGGHASNSGTPDFGASLKGLILARIHRATHQRVPTPELKRKRLEVETQHANAIRLLRQTHVLSETLDAVSRIEMQRVLSSSPQSLVDAKSQVIYPWLTESSWGSYVSQVSYPTSRKMIGKQVMPSVWFDKDCPQCAKSWSLVTKGPNGDLIPTDLKSRTVLEELNPYMETGKIGKSKIHWGANKAVYVIFAHKNLVYLDPKSQKVPSNSVVSVEAEVLVESIVKNIAPGLSAKLVYKGYDKYDPENTNQAWSEIAIFRVDVPENHPLISSMTKATRAIKKTLGPVLVGNLLRRKPITQGTKSAKKPVSQSTKPKAIVNNVPPVKPIVGKKPVFRRLFNFNGAHMDSDSDDSDDDAVDIFEETGYDLEETSGALDESIPVIDESAGALNESLPNIDETAGDFDDFLSNIDETAGDLDESMPGIQGTAAALDEESVPVIDDTAGVLGEQSVAPLQVDGTSAPLLDVSNAHHLESQFTDTAGYANSDVDEI